MKRAEWLIPYSHDHQHGLAQALRLRRAAAGADADTLRQHVEDALAYAGGELADHMATEERELLPAVARLGCTTRAETERIATEHLRLRTLHAQLAHSPTSPEIALEFADALRDHIRWEERELFERWQQRIAQLDDSTADASQSEGAEAARATQAVASARSSATVEPQLEPGASGLALGSLNATNVCVAPDKALEEARIDRDIVLVVTGGSGQLLITSNDDTTAEPLTAGRTIALARGTRRRLRAGPDGLRFTSVHMRRDALAIQPPTLE